MANKALGRTLCGLKLVHVILAWLVSTKQSLGAVFAGAFERRRYQCLAALSVTPLLPLPDRRRTGHFWAVQCQI